jgi:hypothetical protein
LRAEDPAPVPNDGAEDAAQGLAKGLAQVMNPAFFGGMGAPEARLLATEAIVLEKYHSLKGVSRYQARCMYLDYVKSSRVYGAHFFTVEPQNTKIYPSRAVIGINAKCFLVIDPISQVHTTFCVRTRMHRSPPVAVHTNTQTHPVAPRHRSIWQS